MPIKSVEFFGAVRSKVLVTKIIVLDGNKLAGSVMDSKLIKKVTSRYMLLINLL